MTAKVMPRAGGVSGWSVLIGAGSLCNMSEQPSPNKADS
jgi:hypothetical protein